MRLPVSAAFCLLLLMLLTLFSDEAAHLFRVALRDRRVLCGWVPLSARWDLPEQMLTGSDRSTPETGNRQP